MKPILFNGLMVNAIDAGIKGTTRRLVKAPNGIEITGRPKWANDSTGTYWFNVCKDGRIATSMSVDSPYIAGDILYVREAYCKDAGRYLYKADCSGETKVYRNGKEVKLKWHPSIHMPKEAARIFLKVTDVRLERLNDMTEQDALREGVYYHPEMRFSKYSASKEDGPDAVFWKTAVECFQYDIWGRTLREDQKDKYGWDANPFVWVIEFERIERPVSNG